MISPNLLRFFSLLLASSCVSAAVNITAETFVEELFEHYNFTKMDGMLALYNDMNIFANVTNGPLSVEADDHAGHDHGLKGDKHDQHPSKSLRLMKRQEEKEEHDHDHEDHDEHEDEHAHIECMLPGQMLKMHNISALRPLNQERFEHMAPSLVYLATSKVCWKYALASNNTIVLAEELKKELALASEGAAKPATKDQLPIGLVWLYSIIANSIITLVAAIGILLVPLIFRHPVFGDILMTFLIALGASVLAADALLHLIPDVLSSAEEGHEDHNHSATVWYSTVIMAGIYVFWAFEKYLHSKLHCHCSSKNKQSTRNVEEESIFTDLRVENDVEVAPKPDPAKKSLMNDLKTARPVAILIILGDFFHNFVDGVAIGASFATSTRLGITTSLAVLFHEIPHELGDYSVLLAAGFTKYRAALWNMISNLSAFGGMILGILLIQNASDPATVTKWILAVAAGFFLYIALAGLLPELSSPKVLKLENLSKIQTNTWARHLAQHLGLILGWLTMLIIALYGENFSV